MRTFRILAALVMAVVCVGLSSCGKDDENNPIDNSLDINLLYGGWELKDNHYYPNGSEVTKKFILTFNANNTWAETVYINDKQTETYSGTYTYDMENKELTMVGPYEEGGAIETRSWLILVLTKTRFTYLENNVDNGGVAYTRQK